uniref:Beta-hexosaminidase n=1 Tax=Candidatus Kentrum eta TaxID=2126337 RepID=A0A450VHH7_9GAMM|nr:MAG: beta-N-acetylhexosaminidase [Candidatus Kentron sp. H]VFK00127.1 MAG: beta-N-acetylhexosaminidase [Candidatus Kentron sp. H]VFK04292.1 MAG: beta-N-acetylhexosaminidase [Candidatus Kentron sp. H]
MSLGPIMFDLEGPELTAEERALLAHPLVGGVILFSRNYRTPGQLSALVESIHKLREPRLLVAVDHEGGSVQRFRDAFTLLPAAMRLGEIHDRDIVRACALAEQCGWVMAVELRAYDVDFSFAPVLDLGKGPSRVIRSRAFHRDPTVVARLGKSFLRGAKKAGMASVGKHFPGHGAVEADSHVDVPIDTRTLETLFSRDLVPFDRMIRAGLPAVMPAHVIYPKVDEKPAGFSSVWLRSVLRGQLGFTGAIFSDDITMAGAAWAGDPIERAKSALAAGCDMVVVCNNRPGVVDILEGLGREGSDQYPDPVSALRLARLHGHGQCHWDDLLSWDSYQKASAAVLALESEPELHLHDDRPA